MALYKHLNFDYYPLVNLTVMKITYGWAATQGLSHIEWKILYYTCIILSGLHLAPHFLIRNIYIQSRVYSRQTI